MKTTHKTFNKQMRKEVAAFLPNARSWKKTTIGGTKYIIRDENNKMIAYAKVTGKFYERGLEVFLTK